MRTSTLGILLLTLCVFFFTNCGTEEDTVPTPFEVSGVVTSGNGNPLENVIVNTVVDTTLTNPAGEYTIVAYPTGPIEFAKEGFENWVELIKERTTIDVSLLERSDSAGTRYNQVTLNTTCDDGSPFQSLIVEVSDFGEGTGTITWTNDRIWVLQNKVFVNEGQELTIEEGTIIKAEGGQAESAAALVVARGGKIFAEGTSENPIIFTSIEDPILKDLDGNICQATTLSREDRNLWGGIVILGKATLNTSAGENEIEGFTDPLDRGLYGGTDDEDNSGIFRYVSIRHGGTQVTINNELNALTMGGVGNQTVIEYVEAYANEDDGFEWFGGTVNTRYLVSAYNEDDLFDYDEGWRGRNQFWLGILAADSDHAGEHDGGIDDDETAPPFSNPIISNATFYGSGEGTDNSLLIFRDNAAGSYYNSVFLDFPVGAQIEFLGDNEQDSYKNFADGLLQFQNNILFNVSEETTFTILNQSALPNDNSVVEAARNNTLTYFQNSSNANSTADPGLAANGVPIAGSNAASGARVINEEFLEPVSYKGCFNPSAARWMEGWTRVADDF